MSIIEFAVISLAVWRITMMLSDVTEAGPANLLHKIRDLVGVRFDDRYEPYGKNWVADGVLCHKCLSVWIGIVAFISYALSSEITFYVAMPFAFSGVVVYLERCNGI